jgi:signal transduction histidine kinase
MDNACKWARRRVKVKVREREGPSGPTLIVTVEDDGPGLEPTERLAALKRGTRLDEETPGSGLGLSIVRDTVGLYEGHIALDRSELGGLHVEVQLPGALAK